MKNQWPELRFDELKETVATVQLWTQIVGKVRLKEMPWINHSWHVTLYVSPSGLTTGSIPYEQGVFQIDFNFITHKLNILTSTGAAASINLFPRTVSSFYTEFMETLGELGIDVSIYSKPNEIDNAIPFDEDNIHQAYDRQQINKLWQAWVKMNNVFTIFRARFIGKCSPVHFFWGGFDLAVTRFSGREAPPYPGGIPNMPLKVMQEAYSHEVSSCGFWTGSEEVPTPVFYAYCYPTPEEFCDYNVRPVEAFYSKQMGEYFLPYDAVINAGDPENYLLEFLQSTYEAAAVTGNWDRRALEADFSSLEKKKA